MLDRFFKKSTIETKNDVVKNNKASWDWGRDFLHFDKNGNLSSDLDKAQFLKGVKNFVKILTNKNIPVKYLTGEDSFTDGKSITLSSEIKENNLDSTVGLALHEASHIVKSDFKLIVDVVETPGKVLKPTNKDYNLIIKDLFNWVEDRRIDDWVYESAPGYRPYYTALYDRYFLSEETNEAVKKMNNTGIKNPTVQDYLFYIINLLNDEVKGDELPGLDKIKNELVNLNDIKRLKDSQDCLNVAQDIFEIISKNVDLKDLQQYQKDLKDSLENQKKQGQGDDGKDSDSNDKLDQAIKDALKKNNLKEAIKKILEKQRKFGNGNSDKKSMEDKDAKRITVLSNCDTDVETVKLDNNIPGNKIANGYSSPWHSGVHNPSGQWQVVTINKVDFDAIENQAFSIFKRRSIHEESVSEGITLGRMLANKLKQRTEERETKNPRLRSGKIDKRQLHTCGFDNGNIFYNIQVDKYEQLNIHISLDLSGSMGGEKWENTLISTVAILTATAKIKNIRTQLSLRYTDSLPGYSTSEQAFVIQFYDSEIDKESKIKWLQHVSPSGGTPEGLCFEALMNKIIKPIMNKRTIFVNYSDGQPCMGSCSTEQGVSITKQSIKKMRSVGVEILSFFITDGYHGGYGAEPQFKEMYGKDSKMVPVKNLISLAKELNQKFLNKNE